MGFVGLDPDIMRELAARSDLVSRQAVDIAKRLANIISEHQLEDHAGGLSKQLDEVTGGMSSLADLSARKAAEMELAASGALGIGDAGSPAGYARIGWPGRFVALLEIQRRIRAGGDEMSVLEAIAVLGKLRELDPADREWVLSRLTDEEIETLFRALHASNGWIGDLMLQVLYDYIDELPPEEQVRFTQADVRSQITDPAARAAFDSMVASDGYAKATVDQQITLLSQARNYPNANSIHNLERLAAKDWARDFSLDDFQRSAKLIAFMSDCPEGDQEIINNTLDVFLDPDSDFRMTWTLMLNNVSGVADPVNGVFMLNVEYVEPGNGKLEDELPSWADMDFIMDDVVRTTVHEVNHLLTPISAPQTFDRFMAEYRASYVDFVAGHGRPPTRAEMQGDIKKLLGNYDSLDRVTEDPVEGQKIADFLSEMFGVEVAPEDLLETIKAGGVVGRDELAPEPVSVDGGPNNLDNSR